MCLWLELIQSRVKYLLPGNYNCYEEKLLSFCLTDCKVELKYDENGVLFGAALASTK